MINSTFDPEIENVLSVKYLDSSLGVASGDVTSNSVILWSKTNATARMNIEYSLEPNFGNYTHDSIYLDNTKDYAGHYKMYNLIPNSTYYYKIWFSDPFNTSVVSQNLSGKFKTAPLNNTEESISFAVGGDVGGQGYCKKIDIGYYLFSVIKGYEPDFFVANGDMIYADNTCPESGPNNIIGWKNIPGLFPSVLDYTVDWENVSKVYSVYKEHWDYNKADKHYQNLYSNIPVYSQPDDHEIADNYDGNSEFYQETYHNRSGFKNLVQEGLKAFFNYSPIESFKEEPNRIYRSFNWGVFMDIFLLDSHQYRTTGSVDETPLTNKTILGKSQLEWLKNSIKNSKATWKIILNDVPVTIPHCFADNQSNKSRCDNWATDNKSSSTFTRERDDFMSYLDKHNLKNVIFITTDVHYPAIISVDHDFDGDGEALNFYEFTSGPLNARPIDTEPLDPTINATYVYKDSGFFNFGYYEIKKFPNNNTYFTSQVVTGDGLVRPDSKLEIVAE
jgi:alkaline phosphatase D